MYTYIQSLGRKKTLNDVDDGKPKLKRVLTLTDLIGLGVGSTLGVGVYVLAGSVAKNLAGPAVVISFVVAAVASAFAGVCYAEFAARVPKAGSAYVYSYVSVGEFVAFIIGWNLILEYTIGTASVAKALSVYIDALANGTIKATLSEAVPVDVKFLAPYPDFLAFSFVMIVAGLLAFGVKESTFLNNCFTGLNLFIITFVIVAGSLKADPKNWAIPKEETHGKGGEGGFMPYGFKGIMAGAAKCFFAFVGFDCIATTGEEAKKPRRNIPLAILFSLIIIFLSYFGISTVLTMMYPYYLQDPEAPFPHVFEQVKWITVKWIVTIGAVVALCTSLLGAMFPLPRVLYAMGTDGILFKVFARINTKTQTPLASTLLSGLFAGFMAMMLDLQQLIDMMSIGTLLAYTIIAVCVLILRSGPPCHILRRVYGGAKYEISTEDLQYIQDEQAFPLNFKVTTDFFKCLTEEALLMKFEESGDVKISKNPEHHKAEGFFQFAKRILKSAFNLNMLKHPTEETSRITKWGVIALSLCCFATSAVLIYGAKSLEKSAVWAVALVSFFGLLIVLIMIIIGRQPISSAKLSFRVPMVPFIPSLSLFINIYLMLELDYETWIRFAVWMTAGFLIYFFYGYKNSVEGHLKKSEAQNEKEPQIKVPEVIPTIKFEQL